MLNGRRYELGVADVEHHPKRPFVPELFSLAPPRLILYYPYLYLSIYLEMDIWIRGKVIYIYDGRWR